MQPHAALDCEPLTSVRAAYVICYPSPVGAECARRAWALAGEGVEGILLWGPTVIASPLGPLRVVGKGHSSIVAAACTSRGVLALKSRRIDSKRESLTGEARLLLAASRHGAAPRPHAWGPDYILMDLLPGPSLGRALAEASDPSRVAVEALLAARALDTAGILHLELSRPQRHVIFTGPPDRHKALVIDLDSAVPGECGNVSKIAGFLARSLGRNPAAMRGLLRRYKVEGCPERLFHEILSILEG